MYHSEPVATMRATRITLFLFLSSQAILSGANPELSIARAPSGGFEQVTLKPVTAGTRWQLIDGVRPIGIAVADRSGEARLEIKWLSSGHHLLHAVEWGTGRLAGKPLPFTLPAHSAGGFESRSAIETGLHTSVITSGDLYGQGFSDLIFASAGDISVMRNNRGVFSSARKVATVDEPTAIALQDFNGDGKNDLAIAGADGSVTILLNRGEGEFEAIHSAHAGLHPSAIVASDFNSDGIPDLAIANRESNEISILLGNGDGTFRKVASVPTGMSPRALVASDFNGDGVPDLATADFGSNQVSILLGDGRGAFKKGVVVTAGNGPVNLATADFNEDGALDLAVLNQNDGTVSVLLNSGSAEFHPVASIPGAYSMAAGDVDGDGHADLLVQSGNEIRVRPGRGDGSFGEGYAAPSSGSPLLLIVGDFDCDGNMDAATVDLSGKLTVTRGVTRMAAPEASSENHSRRQ